jgi:hypothetical protein
VATIHAEITAGGESIVLVAGGVDVYSIAEQARHLKALTPLFSASDPAGALTVPATWPAVVQLQAAFGDWFVPGPNLRAWIQLQAEARTNLPAFDDSLVPYGLTPYPWQVSGARMIAAARTNAGALITDEPGTGKTITAILGLGPCVHGLTNRRPDTRGRRLPGLASSTPWVEAWKPLGAVPPAVCAWRGTAPAQGPRRHGRRVRHQLRHRTLRTPSDTSTPGHGRPSSTLATRRALVIDECHFIKNARAERSKAVRALAKSARCVVALSGTPITHHPGDLWSALACLEPHAYPSSERWVNRYCHVVPGDYKDEILGLHPHTEPEFRLSLLGAFRRVAKADVLTQLPPKVYSVRTVDLPPAWRKAYDDFEAKMLAELPDGQELSVMDTLSVLTHSAALASAAGDVRIEYGPDIDERGELKRHVHVDLKAPSWKVDALLEVLEERPG